MKLKSYKLNLIIGLIVFSTSVFILNFSDYTKKQPFECVVFGKIPMFGYMNSEKFYLSLKTKNNECFYFKVSEGDFNNTEIGASYYFLVSKRDVNKNRTDELSFVTIPAIFLVLGITIILISIIELFLKS